MISKLRHRAALEVKTLTPDGAGGFSESWDAVAQLWCAVEPLAASDAFAAGKLESRVRHRLRIRRGLAVAAGNRLRVGERLFAVHAVIDEGPPAPLVTLACEELPEGGEA